MMRVEGRGGQVEFDGQFVTITRKGFLARATIGKGDKRIPVASLTAVDWKPAGALVNGYIQFVFGGSNERRSRAGSRTFDAGKDENSVIFTNKQQPQFEQLRSAIEAAIIARHAPVASHAPVSAADELTKLATLRDQGVLTDAEFQAQKARILGM